MGNPSSFSVLGGSWWCLGPLQPMWLGRLGSDIVGGVHYDQRHHTMCVLWSLNQYIVSPALMPLIELICEC